MMTKQATLTKAGKQSEIASRRTRLAQQLRSSMERRGWGPTETARQASALLPDDQSIAPASISHYCSGRALPRARQLEAITMALGIPPTELGLEMDSHDMSYSAREGRPSRRDAAKAAAKPTLLIEDQGNGTVRLEVNQEFPWATAMKILELLKGESDKAAHDEDKSDRE